MEPTSPLGQSNKYLRQLIAAVAAAAGELSSREDQYVRERAASAGFGSEREELEDDAAILAADLRAMRAVGLSRTSSADVEVNLDAAGDLRWELLRDLDAVRTGWEGWAAKLPAKLTPEQREAVVDDVLEQRGGSPRWVPLRVRTSNPIGFYTGKAPPPLGRTVEIHFDSRIPLVRLVRELRAMWPKLLTSGTVQRSRPLGARKIALLRFVCLTMPNASWRERHEKWNRKFPDWNYERRGVFITEFHDAEESLTGRPHALAWFYNAKTRLATADLGALAREGDRDAKRELDRRFAEGLESMKRAGITVVREPRAKPPRTTTSRVRATRKQNAKGEKRGKHPKG